MKVPILDLKRQYELLKDEIEPVILEVARSGYYIMGPKIAAFEKEIADYLGVKHAIAVSNGTDALVLVLKACGIGEGDEVITTPFTFFASAEVISVVGATPVFVDVEDKSFNIDPDKIEEKITSRTKAILPVHIFGQTADMDCINTIAKKHNLFVIEDACQAIGAKYKGKNAGDLADIACFSFFPTKNLGAFGDAGMITTNDDKLAIICKALREHGGGKTGANAKALLESLSIESEVKEENSLYNPHKYYNYLIGHNARMDVIQAAILSVKLKHLKSFTEKRTATANYYIEALKDSDVITPYTFEERQHCWHQFALRTKHKNELGEYLSEKDVTTGAFYPVPLHLQKVYEDLGYKEGDLPVSEMLAKETLCLPIFPELTEDEREYVVECIKRYKE
ncbi:MAG: DegT/DnrJ/EryC1/StrS family aminotransferase [Oscillospiraceae bacterium]|nr:DegT/DnrJ/EryC1/StrS family aminotransferase [Oscillospiraceae bacterium]